MSEYNKIEKAIERAVYNNNISKFKEIAREFKNPLLFGELYRKVYFDNYHKICSSLGLTAIKDIIFGHSKIKSMVKYQNGLNDFVIHDMAVIMSEYNFVIPQDLITDGLAFKILDACYRFGFFKPGDEDVIYKVNTDSYGNPIINHDKIICNLGFTSDTEKLKSKGFTDDDLIEIKRLYKLHKEYQQKYIEANFKYSTY